MIVALRNWKSDIGKTTVAIDPVDKRAHQGRRVIVLDADRKEENENCWLDWSKQRTKEGLTRFFRVIGLAPGAPRREILEIACTVDHVVTGGSPRFAARTRSALLATDVTLTPIQASPSGEGVPVEIRKLLEKARIFCPDIHPRFIRNRSGPRALIVRERTKAVTKQDVPTPWGRVGRRVAFANVACGSQFAWKPQGDRYAAWADDHTRCRNRKRRTVTACDRKSAFAASPRDAQVRSRNPEDRAVESATKAERFIARMAIDITPELRSHIKFTAFHRGLMVTEMPRNRRARIPQRQKGRFDERSHRG